MKLNQTYPLMDLLDALTAASDNTRELAKQLKAEGRHMMVFTVYEAENMLSVSPHARVTLTRKESEDRWAGYMETSAYRDGERVPVAVNRKEYAVGVPWAVRGSRPTASISARPRVQLSLTRKSVALRGSP